MVAVMVSIDEPSPKSQSYSLAPPVTSASRTTGRVLAGVQAPTVAVTLETVGQAPPQPGTLTARVAVSTQDGTSPVTVKVAV